MKTAEFWHRAEDGSSCCDLCPHRCRPAEGKAGRCRVRVVQGGELKASAYGQISSAALDPIEKKPLHHFFPGSAIYSIGSWGCNFSCSFCQNWTISQQFPAAESECLPERVACRAGHEGSIGMAYTYNEPIVGFEFIRDCAALVARNGLANVMVTNGYIRPEPAAELIPLMDAMNIDIKSMDDAFYRNHCGGTLKPVLDFAVQAVQGGCHVEITNLLIPGLNDAPGSVSRLARWMRENLGKRVPLHLSAYRPMYKMKIGATPVSSLMSMFEEARAELSHVFLGNMGGIGGQDSCCPECGHVWIRRNGYRTELCGLKGNLCAGCGKPTGVIVERRRR